MKRSSHPQDIWWNSESPILILHEQIQFYVKENNTAYTLMIFENISNNNKIDRTFTNKFKPNKCKWKRDAKSAVGTLSPTRSWSSASSKKARNSGRALLSRSPTGQGSNAVSGGTTSSVHCLRRAPGPSKKAGHSSSFLRTTIKDGQRFQKSSAVALTTRSKTSGIRSIDTWSTPFIASSKITSTVTRESSPKMLWIRICKNNKKP